MTSWNLYRHRNNDDSSKDWAVITNADGSVSTRWGKTAGRLPGFSTRHSLRRLDIERQKQNKGYVFVAEVVIDHEGNVTYLGQAEPEPLEGLTSVPIDALYWHIDCKADHDTCITLGLEIRRLIADLQTGDNGLPQAEQSWEGWQLLLDLTLKPKPFTQSGQIKQVHGVLPWLFLLALKHQDFADVEIDIATESSREVSTDLKAEPEVLAFFNTDIQLIRTTAEILDLLKPKLNLASALSDTDDCWF